MAGFNLPDCRRGQSHETHVSTLGRPAQADSWIPGSHANSRWAGCHSRSPRKGPGSPGRLTVSSRFRRSQRLERSAVTTALKRGTANRAGQFRVSSLANQLSYVRLAIIVPKRFAPLSVVRNRLRRLVREAVRTAGGRFSGRDLVVRLIAPIRGHRYTLAEIRELLLGNEHA